MLSLKAINQPGAELNVSKLFIFRLISTYSTLISTIKPYCRKKPANDYLFKLLSFDPDTHLNLLNSTPRTSRSNPSAASPPPSP